MKVSILFYPNIVKTNKKTGRVPLYLRVTLDRKKAEMRLNVEVQQSELNKWDPTTMRFQDRKMAANAILNKIECKYEDFLYNSATTLSTYDVKGVRDFIMGVNAAASPKAVAYIDNYYKNAVLSNPKLAAGTKRNYNKALNHLKTFFKTKAIENILVKDLNMQIAYEFKDYLLGANPALGKIALTEPSALDNVKRLRTIFERAVEEGLMPMNPFKKIKLKSKSPKRGRLDIHEVRKLYHLDLSEFPIQRVYRDIFLFSVFTGLSYSDSHQLTHTDLYKMSDDNIRLFVKRVKTDVITEMVLPQQAKDIIDRYKNTAENEITKKVLPGRSNKEVNVQIKILANMANIPIKLSMHNSRHTFRQLLSEADIFEIAVIKRMMGHSRSSDIDEVYYSVTESRLLEAKRKFELYLTKSLL